MLAESWVLSLDTSRVKYSWWGGLQLGAPIQSPFRMTQRYEAKLNFVVGAQAPQSQGPWALRLLGSQVSVVIWRTWCHHVSDVVESIPPALAV